MVRAAFIVVLSGCAGVRASSSIPPATVLEAYADAVREEDPDAVHGLLDDNLRAEISAADLGALMTENRQELLVQADEIEAAASSVQAVAVQPLEGGEEVRMVLEDGGWAIEGGVVSTPGLSTPMATVRALRRSLMRKSLPGVLRVLSRQPRADIEAELARILEETEDELDLEVEVRGNRARVRTTGGREITLVREAGEWRISAIE
jgi:hypothetical protein